MLDHAETKVLIADTEFTPTLKAALALAKAKPLIVNYRDLECGVEGTRLGEIDYEEFLASGDPDFAWQPAIGRMERHHAQLHQRHHRQSRKAWSTPIAAPI